MTITGALSTSWDSGGANLLAMVVNDNARILDKRGVFEIFASKPAPTGIAYDLVTSVR